MTAPAPDLLAGIFSPVGGADDDLTALAQCYRLARERARLARLAAQPATDTQAAAGADTQPNQGGPQ